MTEQANTLTEKENTAGADVVIWNLTLEELNNSNLRVSNADDPDVSVEATSFQDVDDDLTLLQKLLEDWDLLQLLPVLKDCGVTYRSLVYLSQDDIRDSITDIGLRAEFRSKLFLWRKVEHNIDDDTITYDSEVASWLETSSDLKTPTFRSSSASTTCKLSKASEMTPPLQKPAPSFKGTAVVGGQFKDINIENYKGQYLVLFFYPLDFTFVCPTEIIAFSDRVEDFKKINTSVIGCSTDSHFSHLAWINTPRKQGGLGEMNIPLLADKNLEISRAYGVLDESSGIAFRGLFIIDGKGILRQVTVNDLPVGRSVDETLRLVQAFQFTDEHGEVCPAGWTPGKKTIKPQVEESKQYFSSEN